MTISAITSTAILSLILGIAAPAHAQQEQQGGQRDHPDQRQGKHENAKPKKQSARPQGQAGQKQQHSQRGQEPHRVRQNAWEQHRARNWQSDHRTWPQRGGYHGYRIPDDRYRLYFGPQHGFRINGLPFLVVGGYPRFRCHGYWFSLVDPWPEYWASNWYDTDDVYVTNVDNGYYLMNGSHPGFGIAIRISM